MEGGGGAGDGRGLAALPTTPIARHAKEPHATPRRLPVRLPPLAPCPPLPPALCHQPYAARPSKAGRS